MKRVILVLASNPSNTPRLRLDQEVREITTGLERAKRREEWVIEQRWAPRLRDVRRAMLDLKPYIVHFCGHGEEARGIVFENEVGEAETVDGDTLADFFSLFANSVRCVVLNACYSEEQARAIARHIEYVVGMRAGIDDRAAIEFAVAFYDALGAGENVEFAYELARNAIQWAGVPGSSTPVLIKRDRGIGERAQISVTGSSVEGFIKGLVVQRICYQGKARLVKGSGPEVYLVVENVKYWVPDGPTLARLRRRFGNVQVIEDVELDLYPSGNDLPSLCPRVVETPQGEWFLLVDGTRRRILGEKTLLALGGHPGSVPVVSVEEIAYFEEGESIPEHVGLDALRSPPRLVKSIHPEIYLVRGIVKRWVPDHDVLQKLAARFRIPGVQRVEVAEVDELIEGLPIGRPFVPLL